MKGKFRIRCIPCSKSLKKSHALESSWTEHEQSERTTMFMYLEEAFPQTLVFSAQALYGLSAPFLPIVHQFTKQQCSMENQRAAGHTQRAGHTQIYVKSSTVLC